MSGRRPHGRSVAIKLRSRRRHVAHTYKFLKTSKVNSGAIQFFGKPPDFLLTPIML